MSSISYNKWNKIEISDDEDDTHPNIETESLYRMRHQTRLEKMAERKEEKLTLQKRLKRNQIDLEQARRELSDNEKILPTERREALSEQLVSLEKERDGLMDQKRQLEKQEADAPLNVDTICKIGFSSTRIHKAQPAVPEKRLLSEKEKEEEMAAFCEENECLMKEFSMLGKLDYSKKFLLDHSELCSEYTIDYLAKLCLTYQMEGKTSLMEHVAHQCLTVRSLLGLAKEVQQNPKSPELISAYFSKLKRKNDYKETFEAELNELIETIKSQAAKKIQELADKQKQERLGPGGLDPCEVLPTLPQEMQECFISRDLEKLQQVALKMDPAEFSYHLQRCVDSGLWLPVKNKEPDQKK